MPELAALTPGSVFAGEFVVERLLSEGGMGAVYVVEQRSTHKRRALKLMHQRLVSDPRLRERFIQEARVGSQIDSAHVVEVIDAGIDPVTSTPWLVMELLEGETLHDAVRRRGPVGGAGAREILAQLTHAIGAAHDVGIVHRDLKPENVFLAAPKGVGATFHVKVLDFGIAKIVAEVTTRAAQTQAMGTPLWMSPEQSETSSRIRPATDVWALGLIAFYLLTGRIFWRCAYADAPTPLAMMREVLMDPIPPASERARELGCGAALPRGFDAWFARCVDRSVEARYPDARAAFAAIATEWLDDGATADLRPTAPSTQVVTMAMASGDEVSARGETVAMTTGTIVATTAAGTGAATGPTTSTVVATAGDTALIPEQTRRDPSPGRSDGARRTQLILGGVALVLALVLVLARAQRRAAPTAAPLPSSSSSSEAVAADVCKPDEPDRCEKECTAGSQLACTHLALAYHVGKYGRPLDHARARALFEPACEAGVPRACNALGTYYKAGLAGVARNRAKAMSLWERACNAGVGRGCLNLALEYAQAPPSERPPDATLLALHQKACALDVFCCSMLAARYEAGAGVPVDTEKARELYGKACDAENDVACLKLGDIHLTGAHGQPKNPQAGQEFLQRACDLGSGMACQALGRAMLFGTSGVSKNEAQGIALYERACALGTLMPCVWAGMYMNTGLFGAKIDKPAAVKLFERACTLKEGAGCRELGLAHLNGGGVLEDEHRAKELLESACTLGDADGCRFLADLYRNGKVIPHDLAKAKALEVEACDKGSPVACKAIGK